MQPLYSLLLTVVIAVHFLWIAFVVTGWIYCARSRFWRTVHLLSVIYGVLIELFFFLCPLTYLEWELRRRLDHPLYSEPFINHYLRELIYWDLPQSWLIVLALLLLAVTLWRYSKETQRKMA